ncbi:MAG: hypothetical protein HY718_00085 [Planctomycetes bacterium]|nr:hypothetical protein [Planctomycetota bacterium]
MAPATGLNAEPAAAASAPAGLMDMQTEMLRSRPDYVVYVPRSMDGSTGDCGNEHFLVS